MVSEWCSSDFDLVRLYHPDKIGESTPSDLAHARFQAITAAYDILRKKNSAPRDPLGPSSSASPTAGYQTTATYRAMRKRRQELYNSGPVDDSRKDKLIIFGVVMVSIRVDVSLRSLIFRPLLLCWYKPRLCGEKCCRKPCHDIDKPYKTRIQFEERKTGYPKTIPRTRILHNHSILVYSPIIYLMYFNPQESLNEYCLRFSRPSFVVLDSICELKLDHMHIFIMQSEEQQSANVFNHRLSHTLYFVGPNLGPNPGREMGRRCFISQIRSSQLLVSSGT